MIKLIALDLDNTLLEKDLNIAEKTLSLLQQCATKGITIVIATGRLFYSAEKYAKQIGSGTKILCYNGCLVTEADGTEYCTGVEAYSPVQYAINQLNKETAKDTLKDLCRWMVLYGKAAKVYMG